MKTLTAIGISRKGESGFKTKVIQEPEDFKIRPGAYSKFTFATEHPKQYAEMVKAGLPMIGDGKPVLITIK